MAVVHVVVTGGASGIGAAVASMLEARGHAVTVFDRSIDDVRGSVCGVAVDVTREEDLRDAFDVAVDRNGPVSGLVCSAGIKGAYLPALEIDANAMRRVLDVNIMGSFLPAREMVRRLSAPEASVVLISSTTAYRGWVNQVDYGASKAAVRQLTENLAMEWAGLGVRVNAVAPGHTMTAMVEQMVAEGYDLLPVRERTPLGRLATPSEMAGEIVHLLLDASFTTGQCVAVDGGWTTLGK